MNTEDIRKLIGQEEGTELEYKSAKGGFPESFWDTFSAFANTHGGIIVFGIKEKDGRLIPDGLDDSQIAKYKKNFWDCAHNKGKVSATMLADQDLTIEKSELYRGQHVTYYAPFTRQDRIKDYRTAWAHFEKLFS